MNPKYNYSPALQEDARRFEERSTEWVFVAHVDLLESSRVAHRKGT